MRMTSVLGQPNLIDDACYHTERVVGYLRGLSQKKRVLTLAEVERIKDAIVTIRLEAYAAGSWKHEPLEHRIEIAELLQKETA